MDVDFLAEIDRRRARLARRELEDLDLRLACPPADPHQALLPWSGATRLIELARFWERGGASLAGATAALIQALAASGREWALAVRGTPTEMQVLLAAAEADIRRAVESHFPGVRTGEGEVAVEAVLPHALRLAGPPHPSDPSGGERLEPLCRVMQGRHWLYLVLARPVLAATLRAELARVEQGADAVHRLVQMRTGTAAAIRAALGELAAGIERQRARLHLGERTGLWSVGAWLFAQDEAVLRQGAQALHAVLTGARDGAPPEPFRALRCTPGTPASAQTLALSPLTSAELQALVQPPAETYAGYRLIEHGRFEPPTVAGRRGGERVVRLGREAPDGREIAIPLDDLAQHLIVAGLPGTGKTTTCLNLVAELDRHDIPYLVIEPAKTEYRRLRHVPELRRKPLVLTVGDETGVPLRLNPFEVPEGTPVQAHISRLESLFRAAYVLYPPMPEVLSRSIEEVYVDRGWNLATGVNERARGYAGPRLFPTLDDLVDKVPLVVEAMGHDPEVRANVKAGLVLRLDALRAPGSKGPMFNTRDSLSSDALFEQPCVLELESLPGREEKAFLMGLILIRLQEHNAHVLATRGEGGLRHVTLIEEAHRLLRNAAPGPGSEVAANPVGESVEEFANLIKEMRSSGAGIVIAEQSPTELAPAATAMTGATIVHRLLSQADRQAMAQKLGLDEAQTRAVRELATGEALAHFPSLRGVARLAMRPPLTPSGKPSKLSLRDEAERSGFLPPPDIRSLLPQGVRRSLDHPPRALSVAFRRVFNAMRTRRPDGLDLDLEAFGDAALGFAQACLGLSRELGPGGAALVFSILVEREIEARGAHAGWSFAAVDGLAALGSEAFRAALAGSDDAIEAIGLFALALDEGHRWLARGARPFLGCEACPAPCAHRFDVDRAAAGGAGPVAELLRSGDLDGLVALGREIAASAYPDGDPVHQVCAAYCFAVSRLAEAGLAAAMQRSWIEPVAALVLGELHPQIKGLGRLPPDRGGER